MRLDVPFGVRELMSRCRCECSGTWCESLFVEHWALLQKTSLCINELVDFKIFEKISGLSSMNSNIFHIASRMPLGF